MKVFYGICALLIIYLQSFAQTDNVAVIKGRLSAINNLGPGHGYAEGFDNRISGIVGEPYLFNTWLPGNIVFNDGVREEGLLLKYNLFNRKVEVKLAEKVKVGDENQIKEFYLLKPGGDRKYVSLFGYRSLLEKEEFIGFGEVLFEGKVKLLKIPFLIVKDPNYREGFNVGSMDTKLIKKEKIFLIEEDSAVEIKNRNSFKKHSKAIRSFMKANKLHHKNEEDLVKIVEYYDTL